MNMFLVNTDEQAAKSLMEKLSKARDGAIIGLTTEEMNLYNSDDFKHVYTSDNPSMFVEIDPAKTYIAVVDDNDTTIDDLIATIETLSLNIGIVRIEK